MAVRSIEAVKALLKKPPKFHKVVLFGSTSEIGLEVVTQLEVGHLSTLILIGREAPDLKSLTENYAEVRFIKCDFLDPLKVKQVIAEIFSEDPPDIALLAAGVLPPENNELDFRSVASTLEFNSVAMIHLLSHVTRELIENKVGTILVFSSVAAQRPRLKNFTYGASKSALDFYAVGLAHKVLRQGVVIKVLRLGYVFTRMSQNFPPAPFAITKDIAAKEILKSLGVKRIVVYVPRKLRLLFFILRLLPWYVFSKL